MLPPPFPAPPFTVTVAAAVAITFAPLSCHISACHSLLLCLLLFFTPAVSIFMMCFCRLCTNACSAFVCCRLPHQRRKEQSGVDRRWGPCPATLDFAVFIWGSSSGRCTAVEGKYALDCSLLHSWPLLSLSLSLSLSLFSHFPVTSLLVTHFCCASVSSSHSLSQFS